LAAKLVAELTAKLGSKIKNYWLHNRKEMMILAKRKNAKIQAKSESIKRA